MGGYTSRMSRPRSVPISPPPPSVLIGIKGTRELQKRMKIACIEEGLCYAELVDRLLDMREERRNRQRAQQAHPLARPKLGELGEAVLV